MVVVVDLTFSISPNMHQHLFIRANYHRVQPATEDGSPVIELTTAAFEEFLESNEYVMVDFVSSSHEIQPAHSRGVASSLLLVSSSVDDY